MHRLVIFPVSAWTRFCSLFLAFVMSALVLILPNLIVGEDGAYSHGFVSLVMLAISGCYVHGIGFVPRNYLALVLFSPYVCWPVLFIAVYRWLI